MRMCDPPSPSSHHKVNHLNNSQNSQPAKEMRCLCVCLFVCKDSFSLRKDREHGKWATAATTGALLRPTNKTNIFWVKELERKSVKERQSEKERKNKREDYHPVDQTAHCVCLRSKVSGHKRYKSHLGYTTMLYPDMKGACWQSPTQSRPSAPGSSEEDRLGTPDVRTRLSEFIYKKQHLFLSVFSVPFLTLWTRSQWSTMESMKDQLKGLIGGNIRPCPVPNLQGTPPTLRT